MAIINPGDTPIDPQVVDGTELASRLNRLYSAVYSSHSNSSRPPSISAGGVWARTVTGGLDLMFYDGTVDHKIGSSINGVATFGGGGDKFAPDFATATAYKKGDIIWSAAGSRFEMSNKDIAAGSAKAAGDWVTSTDVLSDLLATKAPSVLPTGMRNRIINGSMTISQRGTSFVGISSGDFTLDRFTAGLTGGGVVVVTQQADVPSNNEFQYSLRYAVTTADTSVAAGDFGRITQPIEGYNVSDLIGKTFTLSFWVRSSKTGVHCVGFGNNGANRSYVMQYTVNSANTWEHKSVTVNGGLITAGTWDWTTGIGVRVSWATLAGTTYQTTANAWQTGNFFATSAQVNCLDTIGNIFAITGVQLEAGTVATPFERRDYGTELVRCQRYFQPSVLPRYAGYVGVIQNVVTSVTFPPMRVSPTITATFSLTNATGAAFGNITNSGATVGANATIGSFDIQTLTGALSAEL